MPWTSKVLPGLRLAVDFKSLPIVYAAMEFQTSFTPGPCKTFEGHGYVNKKSRPTNTKGTASSSYALELFFLALRGFFFFEQFGIA